MFSVNGTAYTSTDPNPLLEQGSSTSTVVIAIAMWLAEVMGIPFRPILPLARYIRGWDHEGLRLFPVITTWDITIQDQNNRTIILMFDLCDDNSPLVIGLDQQAHSIVDPAANTFTLMRPDDNEPRVLRTYVSG